MLRIPSPQELGLPEKFEHWRPVQLEALRLLLTDTHRVKVVCLPTGGGKSAIYVAYALLTKRPTCIVTESIGLQEQLMDDFQPVGMVSLMGRRNYACAMRSDYTCEDGYAARCPYKGSIQCPASQAGMRAATSYLVVTNSAKWTTAKRFGQGMEHFEQVVFDEGHTTPEAIAHDKQVILHHREIEKVLGVDFLPASAEMVDWKLWAIDIRLKAEAEMLAAKAEITSQARPSVVRHYLHMRNLTKRLTTVATANPNNWIHDEYKDQKRDVVGFQFDPLRPGAYCESSLFLKTPHVLIFSAMIQPKTLYQLHQPKGSFGFWEFPSEFDPKDAPIIHIPTQRVDRHHPDLTMLWIRHDQIAARRRDRKGIVHTISFARRQDILNASRFADWMIINPQGEPTADTVQEFKQAGPGTILVSPSVGSGYDFAGKACEWQFVCKIPFADSRSKIVKARQEDDKEYGPHLALNKFQNIAGRGTRYRGDRCETFMCDDNFVEWFKGRFGHLAPKHFWNRFRSVQVAPPPPPPL